MAAGAVLTLLVPLASAPAGAAGFDPVVEAKNYAVTLERQAVYDTPTYQAQMLGVGTVNGAHATDEQITDPGRNFAGDLCWSGSKRLRRRRPPLRLGDEGLRHRAAGAVHRPQRRDPVRPRVGDGGRPGARPGIVIVNGSVQADEQMYWYAAQALAKAGYVVLTFDPQGQGQSDTLGAGADARRACPRRPTAGRSTTAPRMR